MGRNVHLWNKRLTTTIIVWIDFIYFVQNWMQVRLSRSESRYVAIAQRSRSLHKYASWRQVNAHKQWELCSCMRTVHARSAFPADNVDNVKVKLLPTDSYRSRISPLLEIMRARARPICCPPTSTSLLLFQQLCTISWLCSLNKRVIRCCEVKILMH